jgi:tRNA (guanine-N7-)-methyltransferase
MRTGSFSSSEILSSGSAANIASKVELVPADCFAPLNLFAVYGRRAALEVDLGCGDASFLAKVAADNPNTDFLGIERLLGRVRSACRRIERAGLTNARILRSEISYAIENMLPPNSVSAFHIMFPDPWPKRRHAPRRLINETFLASLHRTLQRDGTVRIATDEPEYFRQITSLVARMPHFSVLAEPPPPPAVSKFEKRFVERGLTIHRVTLRKVSPLT